MKNNSFKNGFILLWSFFLPLTILLILISISLYRLNSQMNILHRQSSITIAREYAYGCAVFITRRISRGDVKVGADNLSDSIQFKDGIECDYSLGFSQNPSDISTEIVIKYENISKYYHAEFSVDKFLIKILSFLEE